MRRTIAILMSLALLFNCFTAFAAESNQNMPSMTDSLQILTEKGIVSEETLQAIIEFIEANPVEMPEKPDEQGFSDTPEKPNDSSDSNAPEKPDGNIPEKPNGEPSDNTGNEFGGQGMLMLSQNQLDQLLENSIITESEYAEILELIEENKPSDMPGGNMPGGNQSNLEYTAVETISSETNLDGGEYTSETADENVILIDTDSEVSLNQVTVSKSGDSDGGDNCNFYGLNAAILAKGGATVTITDSAITTDADGANGVFSYGGNGGQNGADGDGTTVNISDTTITTTGDNAGGIMTTGGGVTNASDLTIETSGRSSAAIRTDRGGGTVSVTGGNYTTNGLGSPAVYCTADITVSEATLVSNQSEGVCIEGKNNVTLTDCNLTVNNTKCNGNATFLDSIMIYQSMSGDADSGVSTFTMNGGSLISQSGHVFHVTNTNAVISLENVAIANEDAANVLLSVCDDGWSGAENAAELNASEQALSGTILVGENSSLVLNLTNNSSFVGSISGIISDNSGKSVSTDVGSVSVTLDATSSWSLTADTYITAFEGEASQIISNGYTLYVNGIALEGTAA